MTDIPRALDGGREIESGNGVGEVVRPVLFIDAESLFENSVIPAGETATSVLEFALPEVLGVGDTAVVSARLLYRRTFRALAVTKGWTETPQGGPIEIEVAREHFEVPLESSREIPIPTTTYPGSLVLAFALAAAALLLLRRWRMATTRA